ncbi:MAG: D-alanyl-D-alanine carboxypeptidase/D-alanyl-D-alanine-endopeptidase [Acidobacteriota bacterium]
MANRSIHNRTSSWVIALAILLTISAAGLSQTAGRPRMSASPTPTVSPTPFRSAPIEAPTPSPTPVPAAIQTLEELQSKFRQRLFAPEVRRGRVGVKIVSLNSGKVIFENDSEKYFMPASNMKNFTVATAMERLTPDFRFRTNVFAAAPVDPSGVVSGSITIKGSGDISISNAFDPAFPKQIDPFWGIDRLVEQIVAAGVKKITGDIIGDETYFQGPAIPTTWEWDDLQTFDGTEISALPLNDNAIDVSVIPGSAGNQCIVRVSPANQVVRTVNKCRTSSAGTTSSLNIVKALDQNVIEISGSIPAGGKETISSIALTRPAELFVELLKQRLEAKGVTVVGRARLIEPANGIFVSPNGSSGKVRIAGLESPPFAVIAQKTMKPSQNMYTETILWTLGEEVGRKAGASGDSSQIGLAVVKGFLKEIGIPDDAIVQHDGSGLSRHDLITPAAVTALYTYMAKQSKFAQAWRDSLSIGGVDGTLRNRFKGTLAAGNFRGKTGTIDQVSALSGYMTTAGGEPVVLSIVVNDVPIPKMRTSLIDSIVVDLANFNGKIDQ